MYAWSSHAISRPILMSCWIKCTFDSKEFRNFSTLMSCKCIHKPSTAFHIRTSFKQTSRTIFHAIIVEISFSYIDRTLDGSFTVAVEMVPLLSKAKQWFLRGDNEANQRGNQRPWPWCPLINLIPECSPTSNPSRLFPPQTAPRGQEADQRRLYWLPQHRQELHHQHTQVQEGLQCGPHRWWNKGKDFSRLSYRAGTRRENTCLHMTAFLFLFCLPGCNVQ